MIAYQCEILQSQSKLWKLIIQWKIFCEICAIKSWLVWVNTLTMFTTWARLWKTSWTEPKSRIAIPRFAAIRRMETSLEIEYLQTFQVPQILVAYPNKQFWVISVDTLKLISVKHLTPEINLRFGKSQDNSDNRIIFKGAI